MKRDQLARPVDEKPEPKGWLKVFVLFVILGICFNLFNLWASVRTLGLLEGPLLNDDLGAIDTLVLDIALTLVFGILAYIGVRLILTRWPHTSFYWQVVLFLSVLLQIYDMLGGARVNAKLRPMLEASRVAAFDRSMELVRLGDLIGIFIAVAWMLYWQFSKKVAIYFEPSTTSASPARSVAPGFGNRPTRSCPRCGAQNLIAAEYCRDCRETLGADPA